MIRHAGRAAALFAVGALFASGAWAQALTMAQTVTDRYLVAEELLGSAEGTVIKLGSAGGTTGAARPAVRLAVPAGGIESDNTAEITFTLTGAVFAQNVGAATLDLRTDAADTEADAGFAAEVISGGATGDGSVTFLAEATADLTAASLVSFWVPDLRVTPTQVGTMANPAGAGTVPVVGVSITATVVEKRAVKGDAGTGPFVAVSGAADTPAVGAMAAMNNLANRQVVALADAININMGMGPNTATVALNARTMFATSNATYMAQGAKVATKALRVGTLTVTINGGPVPASDGTASTAPVYTLDPTKTVVNFGPGNTAATDDDTLDSSFAGNVDVVIKGAFKTDDMVVYGTPPKPAKIADGMAAVSIPIALGGSQTAFIYVPGGVDPLRPGSITAVAMLNFSAAGNASGKPAMSMGTINYAGVNVDAYAQGVVRGDGMDSSYLRVRCATAPSAAGCTVFLDCHDQAGMNYFGEAGMIGTGSTTVWSSDDVAGVFDGGWTSGRGACDLLSDGTLEVQHMVRSHDTLVNNSAVVGRSLSEARLASIDKALADICSSVDGHAARAAADPDGTPGNTDDVAAIAATVCSNAIGKFGRANVVTTLDTNGDADGT